MHNTHSNFTTPRTRHARARRTLLACSALLAALSLAIQALAPAAHAVEPSAPGKPPAPVKPAPAPVKPPVPVKDPLVVVKAFRAALNTPTVRSAVNAEVLRQVRTVRPKAIVNGRWITPIDLSRVYGIPAVKNAMLGGLAGHPVGGVLGNLPRDWILARYGIALTPNQVASLVMGDLARDIMASVGVDAFKNQMTDVVGVDDIIVLVVWGIAAAYVGYEAGDAIGQAMYDPVDPHTGRYVDDPLADPDGDGIPNKDDPDDDNDGVPDQYDAYPYDPNRSICDCRGGFERIPMNVIGFTNRGSEEIMNGLILPGYRMALQAFQARQTVAVGPLLSVGGRTFGLHMAFPPGIR